MFYLNNLLINIVQETQSRFKQEFKNIVYLSQNQFFKEWGLRYVFIKNMLL